VLHDLPLETRRLRLRPLFVLAWTSALARRRGIIGRRRIVFAVVGLVLDRLLARFDLGGVARDRPDDASPERTLDQRGVDLVWQRAAREFGERPGKRGFGRNLRASLPAEDATQGLVCVEALDQGAGGGNAQDRLGHESSGEGAPVHGRPARPPGRLGNEGFEADHVERGDETTQRFGDGIDILTHRREQIALDVAPAPLHRVERVVRHVYSSGRSESLSTITAPHLNDNLNIARAPFTHGSGRGGRYQSSRGRPLGPLRVCATPWPTAPKPTNRDLDRR